MEEKPESRIILALDVDSIRSAIMLMDAVHYEISTVKIGLELINAQIAGAVAEEAVRRGKSVFWDGAWSDIPTTIANATRATRKHAGIHMVSVHGFSGIEGIRAAVESRDGGASHPRVLVVTVLTSQNPENAELDYGHSRNAQVLQYALSAVLAGADGIICSPKELRFLKRYAELIPLLRIVPGTRSPGTDTHDQKNVDTPETAILNGADFLVIGREITGSKNPAEAAHALNLRIAQALAARAKFEPRKGAVAK